MRLELHGPWFRLPNGTFGDWKTLQQMEKQMFIRKKIVLRNSLGCELGSKVIKHEEPVENDYWISNEVISFLQDIILEEGDSITIEAVND